MSRANAQAVLVGEVTLKGGIDAMWTAMERLMQAQGGFTLPVLLGTTNGAQRWDVSQLRRFLRALERGGWIEVERPSPRRPSHYKVLRRSVAAPRLTASGLPQPEPVNEVLWRTMKLLKTFTSVDLAAAASTPERTIKLATTGAYCCHLAKAGVLRELGRQGRKPQSRRGLMHYAIAQSSGQAPRILRGHSVFLPGEGRIVGAITLEETEV